MALGVSFWSLYRSPPSLKLSNRWLVPVLKLKFLLSLLGSYSATFRGEVLIIPSYCYSWTSSGLLCSSLFILNIFYKLGLMRSMPWSFSVCCIISTPSVSIMSTRCHFFSCFFEQLSRLNDDRRFTSFIRIRVAEKMMVVVMWT